MGLRSDGQTIRCRDESDVAFHQNFFDPLVMIIIILVLVHPLHYIVLMHSPSLPQLEFSV